MNINAIINEQLWKAVPGFPCYECHPTGLIRNAITGKMVGQTSHRKNYSGNCDYCCKFCHMKDANGNIKTVNVHRAIALTFIDIPAIEDEFDWTVDHIDHDTTNNDVRNLRWLPRKLNTILRRTTRPEVARQRVLEYYRAHDIDYDFFNLLSEI